MAPTYGEINRASLVALPTVSKCILPDGKRVGVSQAEAARLLGFDD